jgi:hypothetical protein
MSQVGSLMSNMMQTMARECSGDRNVYYEDLPRVRRVWEQFLYTGSQSSASKFYGNYFRCLPLPYFKCTLEICISIQMFTYKIRRRLFCVGVESIPVLAHNCNRE